MGSNAHYLSPTCLRGEARSQTASHIWKAYKEGGIIFNKGLKWSIANGENVSAWEDFWLPSGPLRNQVDGLLAEGENMLSVKSLLNNMESISFSLPHRIVREIKGILVTANPNQEDILI